MFHWSKYFEIKLSILYRVLNSQRFKLTPGWVLSLSQTWNANILKVLLLRKGVSELMKVKHPRNRIPNFRSSWTILFAGNVSRIIRIMHDNFVYIMFLPKKNTPKYKKAKWFKWKWMSKGKNHVRTDMNLKCKWFSIEFPMICFLLV